MTLPEKGEKSREKRESTPPESTPAKKIKLEDKSVCWKNDINLLDLSDDVLLQICHFLEPVDLVELSQCCTRLEDITYDRTLWRNIDFKKPVQEVHLQKCLKFFQPCTRSLKTYGFKDFVVSGSATRCVTEEFIDFAIGEWNSVIRLKSNPAKLNKSLPPQVTSLTQSFMENLSKAAPNLNVFIAENHLFDGCRLPLETFPSTIEHLSFKNTEIFGVPRCRSFFTGFDKILPNIKRLNLTCCYWFTCHSFLALSKSKTLKELILYGCIQIDDCVPYVSLGFRFGFTALTVLDLRKTMISDRELGCFNSNITLQELYLEAPESNGGRVRVTDMGITMFGNVADLMQNHIPNTVVLLMIDHLTRSTGTPSPLRKLVVRNYKLVTDTSLKHAAVCLTNLTYVDFTGTSCTEAGVATFKIKRPNVTILSQYDCP